MRRIGPSSTRPTLTMPASAGSSSPMSAISRRPAWSGPRPRNKPGLAAPIVTVASARRRRRAACRCPRKDPTGCRRRRPGGRCRRAGRRLRRRRHRWHGPGRCRTLRRAPSRTLGHRAFAQRREQLRRVVDLDGRAPYGAPRSRLVAASPPARARRHRARRSRSSRAPQACARRRSRHRRCFRSPRAPAARPSRAPAREHPAMCFEDLGDVSPGPLHQLDRGRPAPIVAASRRAWPRARERWSPRRSRAAARARRQASSISRMACSMPTNTERADDAVTDVELYHRPPAPRSAPTFATVRPWPAFTMRPHVLACACAPRASARARACASRSSDASAYAPVCSSTTGAPTAAAASISAEIGSMKRLTVMPASASRLHDASKPRFVPAHGQAALGRQLLTPFRDQAAIARAHAARERDDLVGGGKLEIHFGRHDARAGASRRAPGCGGGLREGGP